MTLKLPIAILCAALAAVLASCGSDAQDSASDGNGNGNGNGDSDSDPRTRTIQALDAVGIDGTRVRQHLERSLDATEAQQQRQQDALND